MKRFSPRCFRAAASLSLPLVLSLACTSADIRSDGGTGGMTPSGGGPGGGGLDAAPPDAPTDTGGTAGEGDDGPAGGEGGRGGSGGVAGGGSGGVGGAGGRAGGDALGGRAGAPGGTGGPGGVGGPGGIAGGSGGIAGGKGGTAGGGNGGGNPGGQSGASGGGGGQVVACAGGPIGGATTATPTIPGQLVVSELMHDPVIAHDDTGEWFELYNPSPSTAYDILNCAVEDISGNLAPVTTSVVVPPCGYVALAVAGNTGTDESMKVGFVPSFIYGPTVKFGNDHADGVRLACGGQIIARFTYSDADGKDPRYKGATYSVSPAHLDGTNDTPGSFCPGASAYHTAGAAADFGTPGAPNPPCP